MGTIKKIQVAKLKLNDQNPRGIKDLKFKLLVKSLKEFPLMLDLRPITVDDSMTIIGGNMRYRAAVRAGMDKVPYQVFSAKDAERNNIETGQDKSYEDYCREFVIKDNVGFGEWDWEILANGYDHEDLIEWGMEIPELDATGDIVEAETEFSEFLDEEHNYVVLYFDNRIDWLQAQTHFNLKTVSSKRSNGKPWSKGVGRVLNGSKYLKKLTDDKQ